MKKPNIAGKKSTGSGSLGQGSAHDPNLCAILLFIAMGFFLALGPSFSAAALPSFADYYGTVYIEGMPAPPGTTIEALAPSGKVCGAYKTTKRGVFGYLSCNSLSPEGEAIIREGENVKFLVNRDEALAVGNTSWVPGRASKIKLVVGRGSVVAISGLPERPAAQRVFPWKTLFLALGLVSLAGFLFLVARKITRLRKAAR